VDRIEAKFKQKFGAPGEVPSDEVNERLAGLGAFVEGYFCALVNVRLASPIRPSVSSMNVCVSYDSRINYTRIEMEAVVVLNHDGDLSGWDDLKADITVAMNTYLDSRFPTEKP
jgi:hypothetical protein